MSASSLMRRSGRRSAVSGRATKRMGLIQVALSAALLAGGAELRRAFVGSPSAMGRDASGCLGLRPSSSRPAPTQRKVFESMDTAWMSDPIVSVVGWAALLSGLTILRVATVKDDTHTPRAFLEQKDRAPSAQPVVCLGDSLTRGNLSADWVSTLREQLGAGVDESAVVLNAGVNMECSTNIHKRLEEVIACNPSHVTVLVGTNDLKAELHPVEGAMYRVFGKLPTTPSLEDYESTLVEIRETLLEAGARVALVSPPVLGEDRNHKANKRAAMFADAVQRVASAGGERCTYVPLFEKTAAALPEDGGKPYCGFSFFTWCCMLCFDLHLMGRDLADVQRERNLGVTVDLVHLGPEMAGELADMVASFVKGVPKEVHYAAAPAGGSRLAMAAGGMANSRRVSLPAPRPFSSLRQP